MTYSPTPAAAPLRRPVRAKSALSLLWAKYANIGLVLLVLIGYPVVGIAVAYMDVDSRVISVPYRIFIATYSAVVFFSGWFSKRKFKINLWIWSFLIFYTARIFSDYYFYNLEGALEALTFYGASIVIPCLAVSANDLTPDYDQLIARGLVLIGFPLMLLVLGAERAGLAYNPWAGEGGEDVRLGFEALNPISLGYAAALVILAGLSNLVLYRGRLIWSLLGGACLLTGGLVLLEAGSRGPVIALAVCVLWFGFSKISRFVYLGPAILLLAIGGISQAYVFQHTLDTATGGWATDASSLGRLDAQRIALGDFLQSPVLGSHFESLELGWGWAPHNVIVEAAMATGVVGLVLLLIVLYNAGANVLRFFNAQYPLLTLWLIAMVVDSQFSGVLWQSDALFLLLILALQPKKIRRTIPAIRPRQGPAGQRGANIAAVKNIQLD